MVDHLSKEFTVVSGPPFFGVGHRIGRLIIDVLLQIRQGPKATPRNSTVNRELGNIASAVLVWNFPTALISN